MSLKDIIEQSGGRIELIEVDPFPDAKHVPGSWYDDIETIVAFVRWYLDGSGETWRCATDIFDTPWLYNDDYAGYLEDKGMTT